MSFETEELELYYFLVTELWQNFCSKHSDLYQFTCDEYSILLSGDIEGLEQILKDKEEIIGQIKQLEERRAGLISKLNQILDPDKKINSVTDLIILFQEMEKGKNQNYLKKFNELLISIIEKIQEQNKKNQIFLNKSIKSLRDIKEGLLGKKTFQTYNAQGIPHHSLVK